LGELNTINDADCLVFAVAHDEFKELSVEHIDKMFCNSLNNEKIIIDVKNIFDKNKFEKNGYVYWSL
jgi:UDP-N-acetyl-D-galactosamine dehydrogenase